jgi:hypothetical protein
VPKIGVATQTSSPEALVDADLDTLVTALYVKIEDTLGKDRRPGHPARLTQSELVCLAVAQALLGFHSEHRWIRFAICHLRHAFPYLPHQPGYNKRLRAALPLVKQVIRDLAIDSDFWFDDVWVADSTPVECGRSRPAVKRSELAERANYGYCASHSRWFWGLRLYLITTLAGMPIFGTPPSDRGEEFDREGSKRRIQAAVTLPRRRGRTCSPHWARRVTAL